MTAGDKRRDLRRKSDRQTNAARLMGAGLVTELGDDIHTLSASVDELRESVDVLAGAWQRRYRESIVRRRRGLFLLAMAIVAGMWLNDMHMNACVIDTYVHQQTPPPICDISHPLHTHGFRGADGYVHVEWPTGWSLAGIGIYGVAVAGGLWWYRRPVSEVSS